jgi:glycosyltransferase involved in cell wall biosynthesis
VSKKPCLVTVEGNGRSRREFHPNTVFVSRRHAANHGSTHFVYNGIDPADYAFCERREDYAVFLAKASWRVKNLAGAARVARQAGVELRVLGSRNWPFDLQRRLPPIRGVRYYGMIGGREKVELLSRARCLIFPVRWEEPFGIALIEALVSGCYVAGTPYGSLPEIVTPETGRLSAKAAELAEVVRNPQQFDPAACRDRVRQGGFTHSDMARKYVGYYERILAHGTIDDANAPATVPGFNPRELLPWED